LADFLARHWQISRHCFWTKNAKFILETLHEKIIIFVLLILLLHGFMFAQFQVTLEQGQKLRRSRVRLSAGSYQDLVNCYCSLLARRTVCGRAAACREHPQRTKTNRVKCNQKFKLYNLSRGTTRPLILVIQ